MTRKHDDLRWHWRDTLPVEMSKVEQLVALGLGRYEAIKAVEAGIEVQVVEASPGAELDPRG